MSETLSHRVGRLVSGSFHALKNEIISHIEGITVSDGLYRSVSVRRALAHVIQFRIFYRDSRFDKHPTTDFAPRGSE